MNNRKAKKLRKADSLYEHGDYYTFRMIMESYYWWLKYLKRRDLKTYKKIKKGE